MGDTTPSNPNVHQQWSGAVLAFACCVALIVYAHLEHLDPRVVSAGIVALGIRGFSLVAFIVQQVIAQVAQNKAPPANIVQQVEAAVARAIAQTMPDPTAPPAMPPPLPPVPAVTKAGGGS